MYYDSFTPRTGLAAMPSPRSRIAPYFSGCRETFDDFLEDFEARAYDCRLTDLQQVDALVRYVDPSLRETCKSLSGYRSCNWHQFRNSLIHTFGTITPRHQVMEQKLRDLVEDSSRMRMDHEDDVLQYYQTFRHYSDPLVHSRHMTEEDRDIEFWYGFHPRDRDVLRPRLLALHPCQPHDIPFRLEHIYDCACRAFAYEKRPSFWLREQEFEPRSVSSKYSPSLMSDPRLGPTPSFSRMFSESLSKPAPSAPEDKTKPEPEATPSIIPPAPVLSPTPVVTEPESSIVPTSFSLPNMPSSCTEHASSCTDVVPESEPESSSLITSIPPSRPSLASSCMNVVPELQTTHSITPTTPSLVPATSLSSSCMHIAPEPERENASSTSEPPLTSSTQPDTVSLVPSCHVNVPEPECTPSTLLMSPILPSHVSTPLSLPSIAPAPSPLSLPPSVFVSECLPTLERSAMDEPEPELACSRLIPPAPAVLLPTSSLASLATDDVPEPQSERTSKTMELDQTKRSPILPPLPDPLPAPVHSPSLLSSDSDHQTSVSGEPGSSPASAADFFFLGRSESSSESCETIPFPPSPLEVSNVPVPPHSSTLQARSQERTLEVTSHGVTLLEVSSASEAPSSLFNRSHAFPLLSTIDISSPNCDPPSSPIHPTPPFGHSLTVPPHSSPSQPPPGLVQDDSLNGRLEDSLTIPVPIRSRSLQVDSDSTMLEVTLAPMSPAAPSTPLPSLSSSLRSAQLGLLPFVFVTTAVLFSTLLVVSNTISSPVRKSWSKNEDIGSTRTSTTMSGNAFDLAQLFRLAQQTARPARLVFDPGGLVRFKHYTKTFASASRSHTSPSSPRTTPASPPSFQAIVSSLFSTETRNFSLSFELDRGRSKF